MEKMKIETIKTGKGLAGSRIALIFAPPDAPAGSLTALTHFFNQQPHLRAVPGYHGPNKNHVLRVSGLKDDSNFLELLQRGFPEWQQERGVESPVDIASDIVAQPIDEVDHFPHQGPIRHFVKSNANSLAGMAYLVGNLGLLMSGLRKPLHQRGNAERDWFKLYSAFAYTVAGGVLLAMGRQIDNPRDVYSIMEEVYPSLGKAEEQHKQHLRDRLDRTGAFLSNYVWEINSAINATGAASHIISAAKRYRNGANAAKFEMLSAMGTMTAMAIAALVPEKEGRELIDFYDFINELHTRHAFIGTGRYFRSVQSFGHRFV